MVAINPRFKAYGKSISFTYLSEIACNSLFVFVDATKKPILFSSLFSSKAMERLTGTNATGSTGSLVKSAWSGEDGSDSDGDSDLHACAGYGESCTCTLRRLKAIQETVQHIGYASSEVSLHDAAVVRWAAALVICCVAAWLSTCGVATVALQMGYVTGLGKDARPAETPVVGGRPYAIGIGRTCVMSGAMRYRN